MSAATDTPDGSRGDRERSSGASPEGSTLTCGICMDDAAQPVVVKCGHIYCWSCIYRWTRRVKECPACRHACYATAEYCTPILGVGKNTARAFDPDVPPPPRVKAQPAEERDRERANQRRAPRGGAGGIQMGLFPFPFFGMAFNLGGGGGGAAGADGDVDVDDADARPAWGFGGYNFNMDAANDPTAVFRAVVMMMVFYVLFHTFAAALTSHSVVIL